MAVLAFVMAFVGSSGAVIVPLTPGDQAQDFTLTNYDGTRHSLSQYSDSTAVVVMFIATRCPVSRDYDVRMAHLAGVYGPRGFQFLGINSNKEEGLEEIARHAADNHFPFPVLKDSANVIADRFGAQRTPEVYVLARSGVVLYHGRIDDNRRAHQVESNDLEQALQAILQHRAIPQPNTQAFGCTIKRVDQ
jgi:peroxiredoxin